MKNILLTIFASIAISLTSFGQAPEGFKYQAVVRDAGNLILNNQAVGMQLTIQQGSIGGTAVYTETFATTTNTYGLVNIEIGTGTTSDDFTTIDWANGPYFIETAVDVTGGTSYSVMGTSQLMSVPYALHAKMADSIVGGVSVTEADPFYTASEAVNITATDIINLGNLSGTNTGDQNLTVSQTGDTLTINGGNSVLVPGISLLNFPPPPAVGDSYQGGIVAYILQLGDSGYDAGVTHGLIAAPTDQSSGIFWHATITGATGATATVIGTGQANTSAIIALYGTESNAAKLCDDLVIGGYSDWYLPSIDELEKLYNNRVAIGGFDSSAFYWSSTEFNTTKAFYFRFDSGTAYNRYKINTYSVRAVRAF